MAQDRRRDVVRDIRHQLEGLTRGEQRRQVEVEHVAAHHAYLAPVGRALRQRVGQHFVELNRHDLRTPVGQLSCERADARPDLQHHVARTHLCRAQHALQGLTIDEKVLAKGFLGMQSVGAQDATRLDDKRWHEMGGCERGSGWAGDLEALVYT